MVARFRLMCNHVRHFQLLVPSDKLKTPVLARHGSLMDVESKALTLCRTLQRTSRLWKVK